MFIHSHILYMNEGKFSMKLLFFSLFVTCMFLADNTKKLSATIW